MKHRPQLTLALKTWGGARPGAGRKPKGKRPGVSHSKRPSFASRYPVHVTTRVVGGLPNLRWKRCFKPIRTALETGCQRAGFRLVEWSVQGNHFHLIVEAPTRQAFSRGIQGLKIRIARRLNASLHRTGKVFSDRYHERILKTPREVRHALAYVLNNARRHGLRYRPDTADPFSSGPAFNGWKVQPSNARDTNAFPARAAPRTWLLRVGWRHHGRIEPGEVPRGHRARRTKPM